jgi:methyl-accepting chemotaxis protein
MTRDSKRILIGAGWTTVVMAALLGIEPAARTLPVMAALFVLPVGVLLIGYLGRQNANGDESRAASLQVDREILERSGEAMRQVSGEATRQIVEMRDEVARTQNIFNDAIGKLIASFQDLNLQVQRQRHLGMLVVAGSEGSSVSEFQEFASKTSDTLRQFVDTNSPSQSTATLPFRDRKAILYPMNRSLFYSSDETRSTHTQPNGELLQVDPGILKQLRQSVLALLLF